MSATPPVLDLTDPANPCTSDAFLGYKVDVATGRMFWRVCCECDGKHAVEAEAERLNLSVTHTFCPKHYAEQIARVTGDTL